MKYECIKVKSRSLESISTTYILRKAVAKHVASTCATHRAQLVHKTKRKKNLYLLLPILKIGDVASTPKKANEYSQVTK